MTESFRSVRPSWIAFGWFIAAALSALVLTLLAAVGVISIDAPSERVWVSIALVLGFGVAGFFVGTRVNAAPVIHGVGMGLFSLVVWVAVNLFLGEPTGVTAWDAVTAGAGAMLLLLQVAAAVVGARMGVRYARRGE